MVFWDFPSSTMHKTQKWKSWKYHCTDLPFFQILETKHQSKDPLTRAIFAPILWAIFFFWQMRTSEQLWLLWCINASICTSVTYPLVHIYQKKKMAQNCRKNPTLKRALWCLYNGFIIELLNLDYTQSQNIRRSFVICIFRLPRPPIGKQLSNFRAIFFALNVIQIRVQSRRKTLQKQH